MHRPQARVLQRASKCDGQLKFEWLDRKEDCSEMRCAPNMMAPTQLQRFSVKMLAQEAAFPGNFSVILVKLGVVPHKLEIGNQAEGMHNADLTLHIVQRIGSIFETSDVKVQGVSLSVMDKCSMKCEMLRDRCIHVRKVTRPVDSSDDTGFTGDLFTERLDSVAIRDVNESNSRVRVLVRIPNMETRTRLALISMSTCF